MRTFTRNRSCQKLTNRCLLTPWWNVLNWT